MISKHSRARPAILSVIALAIASIAVVSTSVGVAAPASAATGSDFDAGMIITDEAFYNSAAMDVASVQAFLSDKGASCSSAGKEQACLKQFSQSTSTKAADQYCGTYSGGPSESAATIIVKVGKACGINPQVLLVLLEKEQSLVTTTNPTNYRYRSATGYGCPDTAECDAAYYGFFNQVYNAARAFKRYAANPTGYNYRAGQTNAIQLHPNTACGTKQVFIQNQATASLYIYTPYTPNDAALANLYGSGDGCSSYGNRNFWRIFTDWFGATGNLLSSPSFEGGSFSGWGESNGFVNRAVYKDPAYAAPDGQWFAAMNTAVAGRAMTQDVTRTARVGEEFTFRMMVRSHSGAAYSGMAVIWGLGGTTEQSIQNFTVHGEWTEVAVSLPVRASAHSKIRIDIYLLTVGDTLLIDDTSLTVGQAPAVRNLLQHPSFEGSFSGWIPGNGFVNQQIYKVASQVKHLDWFAASNTPVAGRSFAQDIAVSAAAGDEYTFSVWLRSSSGTFDGRIALWGLGGPTASVEFADFAVGEEWTLVTQTLRVTGPVTQLRAEVYMNTTGDRASLWLDDAAVSKNQLQAPSFEGGAFNGWGGLNGSINTAVYSSSSGGGPAKVGDYFAATNTATAGRSLGQNVAIRPTVGDTYVAEVWLRSSDPSIPFTGTLAVWSLGGSSTGVSSVPFSVGGEWTRVMLDVPITSAGTTSMRFEIYLESTDATLFVDGASLR